MARRKLPYREGDWFAVPLEDGGWTVGLAARVPRRGSGLFAYFFGPRQENVPSQESTEGLKVDDAVLSGNVSDLGLRGEKWPVIFRPETWTREAWPFPPFGRVDEYGRGTRSWYDENDIDTFLRAERCSAEEARKLPKDGFHGYVALQITLTRVLQGIPPYWTVHQENS